MPVRWRILSHLREHENGDCYATHTIAAEVPDDVAENQNDTETSRPGPWFQTGLRFTCTRCGACCTGVPGYVWVTEEELERIAEYIGLDVAETRRRFTRTIRRRRTLTEQPNGDCVFYDRETRACTIYPVRPVQCQTWPFWPNNVSTPQAWAETCQTCPGAGRGRLYTVEEILEASKKTRRT